MQLPVVLPQPDQRVQYGISLFDGLALEPMNKAREHSLVGRVELIDLNRIILGGNLKMKHLLMAVLFIISLATILGLSEPKTVIGTPALQQRAQPLFLDGTATFDFIAPPNTPLGFQNPVRIRNIDYPWVLVEPTNVTSTRSMSAGIWVNMDLITVVRKH
ncbi:MAG TPA: hypothetical protein VF251_00075 [Pyrinomonadaceae bacterium]